jgi:nucleotide-binding universal stress UspA family protein
MSTTLSERSGAGLHPGERHRILIVANETCGPDLCDVVQRHASDGEPELFVITPALTKSRFQYWASDLDEADAEAKQKLRHALTCLSEHDLPARGHIGDPNPVQAIEDALHEFEADEIIIATHPSERSNWLEKHVVERARRFGLPTTHVVVDRS